MHEQHERNPVGSAEATIGKANAIDMDEAILCRFVRGRHFLAIAAIADAMCEKTIAEQSTKREGRARCDIR